MPASPTISFTDSANGGGCAITVAGSDVGSSNQVYYRKSDESSWSTFGAALTGDGTRTVTLSSTGYYWFYCLSSLSGSDAVSNVLGLKAVTSDSEALFTTILNAVVSNLQSLTLTGIDATAIMRRDEFDPQNKDIVQTLDMPCVLVVPGQTVDAADIVSTNTRDGLIHHVNIFTCYAKSPDDTDTSDRHHLWQERIFRYLTTDVLRADVGSNMHSVRAARRITIEHADSGAGFSLCLGWIDLAVQTREPRGV